MSAKWNQTTEHVLHSEGISNQIFHEYPQVYKLLQEELQSTAAYLNLNSNIQSIPYRSRSFQGITSSHQSNFINSKKKEKMNASMDEEHPVTIITQSVEKQLTKLLPSAIAMDVGKTIAEECLKTLPLLSTVPPGGHCLVANRTNGIFDSGSETLIWSVSYDLHLTECAAKTSSSSTFSYSSPSTKEQCLLEGTLNVFTLCCNRAIIDNLEKRARKDYYRTKEDISRECPRAPISLEPQLQSVTEKTFLSPAIEFPQTYKSNSRTGEEALLQQSMAKIRNCVVSILTIKALKNMGSMSTNTIVRAVEDIKSYIEKHLGTLQETFLVQNHLIILYSFNNISQVMGLLQNIQSSRDAHFHQSSRAEQSTGEFTIQQQHINTPTFDDVMHHIHD
jgi:hypothetical protein